MGVGILVEKTPVSTETLFISGECFRFGRSIFVSERTISFRTDSDKEMLSFLKDSFVFDEERFRFGGALSFPTDSEEDSFRFG